MGPVVRVVAAIVRRDRRLLIARRLAGTHLAGMWELPGGKVEPGEGDAAALARELREELGVEVAVGPLYERVLHAYPEKTVELLFHECELRSGEPRPLEVADVAWVAIADLGGYPFPPADAPVIERLQREAGVDGQDA